jgi:hypothetical protein
MQPGLVVLRYILWRSVGFLRSRATRYNAALRWSRYWRRMEEAMARFLVAIFVIVHSVVGHSDTAIAADSSPTAIPKHVPFNLTCRRTADDQQSVSGVLDLSERGQYWQPSDDAFTSIGKNWQLRGDWRSDDAQLRVSLRTCFENQFYSFASLFDISPIMAM